MLATVVEGSVFFEAHRRASSTAWLVVAIDLVLREGGSRGESGGSDMIGVGRGSKREIL